MTKTSTCPNHEDRTVYSKGLCRSCYSANLAARKASGEILKPGPDNRSERGEYNCSCGCGKSMILTGGRLEAKKKGRPVFSSRACQKKGNVISVVCASENCSNEVVRPISYVTKRTTGKLFCSNTCRNKTGTKPKTGEYVACAICGENTWQNKATPRQFCGPECHNIYQRRNKVTRNCDYCGIEYTRAASVAGRFHAKECEYAHTSANAKGHVNQDGYRVLSMGGLNRLEHRVFAENQLGRPLTRQEQVHHVNGDRADNRTDGPFVMDVNGRLRSGNLEIWSTSQPSGQEIGPKLEWARKLIEMYESDEEN